MRVCVRRLAARRSVCIRNPRTVGGEAGRFSCSARSTSAKRGGDEGEEPAAGAAVGSISTALARSNRGRGSSRQRRKRRSSICDPGSSSFPDASAGSNLTSTPTFAFGSLSPFGMDTADAGRDERGSEGGDAVGTTGATDLVAPPRAIPQSAWMCASAPGAAPMRASNAAISSTIDFLRSLFRLSWSARSMCLSDGHTSRPPLDGTPPSYDFERGRRTDAGRGVRSSVEVGDCCAN